MKLLFSKLKYLSIVLMLSSNAYAYTYADLESDSKLVAKAWFNSLIAGDAPVTLALSSVPFSFDRKMIIKEMHELRDMFDKVVTKKGARTIKIDKVEVLKDSEKLNKFKLVEGIVCVVISAREEDIYVFVDPSKNLRITGFTD